MSVSDGMFAVGVANSMMLLILAVMGNFVAETLSCETQELLTNNMLAKHLIVIFMIFFTLNFTSSANPYPPLAFRNALIIWVLFVMFGKTRAHYTVAIGIILASVFVTKTFRVYYKKNVNNKGDRERLDKHLLYVQEVALACAIILIVVGFFLYLSDKRKEYGRRFKMAKFIFGVKTCKGLKGN